MKTAAHLSSGGFAFHFLPGLVAMIISGDLLKFGCICTAELRYRPSKKMSTTNKDGIISPVFLQRGRKTESLE